MYQFILIVLVFFSGIEVFTGRKSRLWFNISYFLMTFVAVFRYGQLSDYFNYYNVYLYPEQYLVVDPLFGLIILLFKACSIDYIVFSALWSLVCMLLSYRFFSKDCENSCLSLLCFYGYTYLMCPMSAIRQGLCLALLMYLYHDLKERRYKRFYICLIVGCFIHLSFIICLILPFLMHLKLYNKTIIYYLAGAFTVLAIVGISVMQFLPFESERLSFYEDSEGVGIMVRMLLRILIIIPVLLYKPDEGTDGYYAKAICLIGYFLYCFFSFNDLIAARFEYYFRTFICLFAAYQVTHFEWRFRAAVQLVLILVVHTFLWYKNIDTEIERWDYREGITPANFPYISVFNKSQLKETCDIDVFGYDSE